jgi:hypothetical protein
MVRFFQWHLTLAGFWLCFVLCIGVLSGKAQVAEPSNSFQAYYQSQIPSLQYAYSEDLQTHHYTRNWDLDQDGLPDSIWFVGTGGAHLYFFLRVMLSTDKKIRDYPYLQTDFPRLALDKTGTTIPPSHVSNTTSFAIVNLGPEDGLGIYIRLDQSSFQLTQKKLAKRGIQGHGLIIQWKTGKEKWIEWKT